MISFSNRFDRLLAAITDKLYKGTEAWKPGWPSVVVNSHFEKIPSCEAIIASMPSPPGFKNEGNIAVYDRDSDTVIMPDPLRFTGSKPYYATLFHEMSHSTAHESRLNRLPLPMQGTAVYMREKAKEEIIAELSAAALCDAAGIISNTVENHAAFIKGWMAPVMNDFVLLERLAGEAKAAALHILCAEL